VSGWAGFWIAVGLVLFGLILDHSLIHIAAAPRERTRKQEAQR